MNSMASCPSTGMLGLSDIISETQFRSGEPLVQVSAQVMTRDDSSGGWVLMGGGGLSRVRLCKLNPFDMSAVAVEGNNCSNSSSSSNCDENDPGPPHHHHHHHYHQRELSVDGRDNINMSNRYHPTSPAPRSKPEYIILGQRNVDNAVILNCRLKKDIQYTKVNPKFHHWKTDEKKFGLSFERSEDAESFDQAIRLAVADLNKGFHNDVAVDSEEGIFSYMELPLVRKDSSSHSASTTSTTTSSPGTNSPQSPLNTSNNNNDPFSFIHQQQQQHIHQQQQQQQQSSLLHSKHQHLHQVYYSSSPQQRIRNVHTNGCGNVITQQLHHHPHRLPIFQQQHHHHLQQQQHKQHQYQLQHQHQLIQPPNHPSSPVSEKSSVHKSSFDSSSGQEEIWVRSSHEPSSISGKSEHGLLDYEVAVESSEHRDKEESYVIFNKNKAGAPHEYSYPNLEPAQKPPTQRSITKKQALPSGHTTSQSNPPLPIKNKPKSKSLGVSSSSGGGVSGGEGDLQNCQTGPPGARSRLVSSQAQCKHCREVFSLDDNLRGSCEDAPDSVVRCMECVSCVTCATCLMYHCLADADGEYRHPCSCAPGDPNQCKRWTALSLLSLLLPCLWCYPPLKACHYCGTQCGLCGGRHKAA